MWKKRGKVWKTKRVEPKTEEEIFRRAIQCVPMSMQSKRKIRRPCKVGVDGGGGESGVKGVYRERVENFVRVRVECGGGELEIQY